MESLNQIIDVNYDLIDESKTWASNERIWDSNMNRVIFKEAMNCEDEYVIF